MSEKKLTNIELLKILSSISYKQLEHPLTSEEREYITFSIDLLKKILKKNKVSLLQKLKGKLHLKERKFRWSTP